MVSQIETKPPPPILRRWFHLIAGSSIPLVGIFVSEWGMVAVLTVVSAGGLCLELIRFRFQCLNQQFMHWLSPLLKPNEGVRFTGATYMVVGALFAFLLFGVEVAVPVLLFLALGDPAAALVGRRMPGPRISGKSPGGTVVFVGLGLATVGVLTAAGAVDYHWGLLVGALVAGVVELAPGYPDDNLTIPLIAGASMHFMGV